VIAAHGALEGLQRAGELLAGLLQLPLGCQRLADEEAGARGVRRLRAGELLDQRERLFCFELRLARLPLPEEQRRLGQVELRGELVVAPEPPQRGPGEP
jgi:hypothetical protein